MDEPLALIKKMHQETEETEDKNRKTPVRHLQVTAFNKLYCINHRGLIKITYST